MFFSIKPEKDTTITDLNINGVQKTGSNSGQSEIVELYHVTSSLAGAGTSRILMKFDLTELSSLIVAGDIASSSVEYRLHLKNAEHAQSIPSSFDVEVLPLTKDWDEGRGLSMQDEGLKDSGFANWTNAKSVTSWDSPGADFSVATTGSQHFDFGTEDLNIDISNIVYGWLTGGVANHGLMIKLADAYETGSVDVSFKKFFSRHALVPSRRPKIGAYWKSCFQDDRSQFPYGVTGSLGYYRFIGGAPNNIAETVYVDIIASGSVVTQTLTASMADEGVYEVSGAFFSPTPGTDTFRDVWFTATDQLFTGTITPVLATGSQSLSPDEISVNIPNLKPVYSGNEQVIVRVFARPTDYRPPINRFGSIEPVPTLLRESFFQIENAENGDVIVPFSTGSIEFSKLSYDAEGNYFKVFTNSLPGDGVYKIKILADWNKKRYVFDKGWSITIRE